MWRVVTDTPKFEADDLTGEGSKITEGRWSEKGVRVVYASETRALACMETVVHLNAGGLPLNRYLVAVSIPDAVWARGKRESASSLPVGWDAEPAGRASIIFGTTWLRSGSSALLIVPSVIVVEEFNILINPRHPDSPVIAATKIRKWLYDSRLTKGP